MYIDFATREGVAIAAGITARIAELSLQLEASELSQDKTNQIRGAISELRRLTSTVPAHTQVPSYSNLTRRGA